jgi:hypothetical protein
MTFRESVNLLGDRALAKFVGPVDAGACVISAFQFCSCLPKLDDSCWSRNVPGKKTQYEWSCFGQCTIPRQVCC